jgi:hypothetical protein
MSPDLRLRWRSHLCGLCLTLRDFGGQRARVLTGYDVLLLSVLVEAQAGPQRTTQAGPCPLRAMQPATVVAASTPAMQLAAAGTLLTGAAGLHDKLDDGDLPAFTRRTARRAADHFRRDGDQLAEVVALPTGAVLSAPSAAAAVEARPGASLQELLAPTSEAVAELFTHTADVAGTPHNAEPLRRLGAAFGRLIHLADAIEDCPDDRKQGRFNPLDATGTNPGTAYDLAVALAAEMHAAFEELQLADPALAEVLFGPTLDRAVQRLRPTASAPAAVGLAAVAVAATAAVFGSPRRRRRYGSDDDPRNDPYYDPRRPPSYDPRYDQRYGYGYRRPMRGPSCCDILACECCANMACGEACGGECCCCVV